MDIERIAKAAGAISDATRLRLPAMLMEESKAVSELTSGASLIAHTIYDCTLYTNDTVCKDKEA